MSTVFVTNRSPTHDYSPAAKFGSLRFVTMGNYPIFKTGRLQEEIIDALIHSTPDDFLVISGSGTIAAMCMAVWLELHGKVKMLLWDRTEGTYVVREINKPMLRVEIETARDKLPVAG
jgi:hypothetical protein